MIQVKMRDGTTRMLDEAQVRISWPVSEPNEGTVEYGLADVEKLVFVEPELFTMPGLTGGMPVVGLALRDSSDLMVETAMPTGFALDFATAISQQVIIAEKAVAKPKIERVQSLPAGTPPPPGAPR